MAETKRKAVAEHELLDAAGNVMEDGDESQAHGVHYQLKAGGDPVQVMWNQLNADAQRMYGLFGVKTLLTNISSQSRQAGRSSVQEQIDDINARLALINSGTWVDRTREAFKPDLDMLVEAFAQYAVSLGKVTQEQVDSGKKAEWRQRADDSADWVKNAYGIGQVREIYAKLAGKPVKSVDDLL